MGEWKGIFTSMKRGLALLIYKYDQFGREFFPWCMTSWVISGFSKTSPHPHYILTD